MTDKEVGILCLLEHTLFCIASFLCSSYMCLTTDVCHSNTDIEWKDVKDRWLVFQSIKKKKSIYFLYPHFHAGSCLCQVDGRKVGYTLTRSQVHQRTPDVKFVQKAVQTAVTLKSYVSKLVPNTKKTQVGFEKYRICLFQTVLRQKRVATP